VNGTITREKARGLTVVGVYRFFTPALLRTAECGKRRSELTLRSGGIMIDAVKDTYSTVRASGPGPTRERV